MDRSKWEYKKLGEVATCHIGLTYKPTDVIDDGGAIVLRSCNIQNNSLSFDDIVRVSCTIPPTKIVQKGDILMCSRNGSFKLVGKVAEISDINEPMSFGAFMTIIRSEYNKFLFHFFLSTYFRNQLHSGQTSTINQITTKMLNNINIHVPPLADQQRIVAELDCLNEMIAVKQEQLREFDKLAQSIFYDMFGDVSLSFQEFNSLYEFIDYRGKTPNKISAGVPLITARNIRFGYLDYSVPEFISFEEFETRKTRGVAHKGDILFTTEAPMGFVAIADKDVFSTGQRVITLQRKDKVQIHNVYMLYYLMSEEFQRILLNNATGVTVKGIKAAKLKKIKVGVPPLSLQQQFAEKIQAIETQKELVKQSIAETQSLLDYTMDKYFG